MIARSNQGHVYTCPVQDHFDGTYRLYCQVVPGCVTVEIYQRYALHHAFIEMARGWRNKKVTRLNSICFEHSVDLDSHFTGWKIIDGRLRWQNKGQSQIWQVKFIYYV